MRRRVVPLLALVLLGLPAAAWAQTAPAMPRPPARSELAVTAGVVGPVSFGSSDATLTTPGGSPSVLFRTDNRLATGAALEVHLGSDLTPRLLVEATGLWHRADFQSRVTDDAEGADDATIAQSSQRFGVLGALVWTIRDGGRMSWFVRGGGGWMREVAGTGALVRDGAIASAGGGMKYWIIDRPGTRIQRIGLRVEGRAELRTAALTLGSRDLRVAPVVVAGVIFRF